MHILLGIEVCFLLQIYLVEFYTFGSDHHLFVYYKLYSLNVNLNLPLCLYFLRGLVNTFS
uniref:Uncharacterized protein n=1 Tax=uncultured marine virus TaxID=186617 RepID=A0A0F7L867_9VIRU|nr:hypothetical protein [uncultured marine virus]